MDFFRKLSKFSDLAYDVTVGLVQQYRQKALEFARLKAASYYLEGVRLLRRQCLLFLALAFCITLASITVVVVPIALFSLMPWPLRMRLVAIAVYGLFALMVPLGIVLRYTSEKKWLEFAKSVPFFEDDTKSSL